MGNTSTRKKQEQEQQLIDLWKETGIDLISPYPNRFGYSSYSGNGDGDGDYKAYETDPTIWGLLTPFNKVVLASRRRQGAIHLRLAEQCIGLVLKENPLFPNETDSNYGIYLTRSYSEDAQHTSNYYPSVFLRDASTFDTYVNGGKKLTKDKPVQIYEGDIISFGATFTDAKAMSFRYKDIPRSNARQCLFATYDDQLKGLRHQLVEMKKLLCEKEHADLKAKAELKLQPLDQVSEGLGTTFEKNDQTQSNLLERRDNDEEDVQNFK